MYRRERKIRIEKARRGRRLSSVIHQRSDVTNQGKEEVRYGAPKSKQMLTTSDSIKLPIPTSRRPSYQLAPLPVPPQVSYKINQGYMEDSQTNLPPSPPMPSTPAPSPTPFSLTQIDLRKEPSYLVPDTSDLTNPSPLFSRDSDNISGSHARESINDIMTRAGARGTLYDAGDYVLPKNSETSNNFDSQNTSDWTSDEDDDILSINDSELTTSKEQPEETTQDNAQRLHVVLNQSRITVLLNDDELPSQSET